jgi:hypothetical protein
MNSWKVKYPALAALVAEGLDLDGDDAEKLSRYTDSDEEARAGLDALVASGLSELRAATEAEDVSLGDRARALRVLSGKMADRMHCDRAVFKLLE